MILKTGMNGRMIGIAGVLAVACVALPAAFASAAVHVDPNGPAGQQYALPLDSVRGQTSGNPGSGVPGATKPPPLFGQGVTTTGHGAAHPGKKQGGGKKHGAGQSPTKNQ